MHAAIYKLLLRCSVCFLFVTYVCLIQQAWGKFPCYLSVVCGKMTWINYVILTSTGHHSNCPPKAGLCLLRANYLQFNSEVPGVLIKPYKTSANHIVLFHMYFPHFFLQVTASKIIMSKIIYYTDVLQLNTSTIFLMYMI